MSVLNNNKMHSEKKKWKHSKSEGIMGQKEYGFISAGKIVPRRLDYTFGE